MLSGLAGASCLYEILFLKQCLRITCIDILVGERAAMKMVLCRTGCHVKQEGPLLLFPTFRTTPAVCLQPQLRLRSPTFSVADEAGRGSPSL